METPAYDPPLRGDISVATPGDRAEVLARLIERAGWHHWLPKGSDHPYSRLTSCTHPTNST